MQYLLDTVAVIRHFTGRGRIGLTASLILDSVEDKTLKVSKTFKVFCTLSEP